NQARLADRSRRSTPDKRLQPRKLPSRLAFASASRGSCRPMIHGVSMTSAIVVNGTPYLVDAGFAGRFNSPSNVANRCHLASFHARARGGEQRPSMNAVLDDRLVGTSN